MENSTVSHVLSELSFTPRCPQIIFYFIKVRLVSLLCYNHDPCQWNLKVGETNNLYINITYLGQPSHLWMPCKERIAHA